MDNRSTEGKDDETTVSAETFRRGLRRYLNRALQGETTVVTKHGEPVAVLTPVKPAA